MKIRIQGIEIAHGEVIRDNAYYEEYFEKNFHQEKERTQKFFKEVIGREKRYIRENKTGLELSYEAIDKVLANQKVDGKEIDIIIYSANLSEYISPPTSLLVHQHIGGSETAMSFDLNVSCAGMTVGLNLASSYLQTNPQYKRALIVGYDNLLGVTGKDDLTYYGQFGDVACALLIEKTEDESEIIDHSVKAWSKQCEALTVPPRGFSSILAQDTDTIKMKDLKVVSKRYEENIYIPIGISQIQEMLDKHNLRIEDIKATCFTQISKSYNNEIEKTLGISEEQAIFIADKYGYTGTSSPFIALYEGIKSNKIQRGDLIILWGIGVGAQGYCNLLRY